MKTNIPRYDGHGNVFCHNCRSYLPADRFAWKASPSMDRPRYNSYCRPCQREIDRMRWTGDRRLRLNERRLVTQAKHQRRDRKDRMHFVADAIQLLRRRGLTKAEISRLADVSMTSLLKWERKERRVTTAVADRFGVLLRETAYLRTGDTPEYRRRLPHPDLPLLMERCRPQVERYPVRNSWINRTEVLA